MFPCKTGIPAGFAKPARLLERNDLSAARIHIGTKKTYKNALNALLSTGALNTRKACVLSWVSKASQSAHRSLGQNVQRYHFPTMFCFTTCPSQHAKACVRSPR